LSDPTDERSESIRRASVVAGRYKAGAR